MSTTAAYVQDGGYLGLVTAGVFAVIGYVLRRLDVSILPFVIGFLLAPTLENLVRDSYTASGGDALFPLKSPIALVMLALSALLLLRMSRRRGAQRLPRDKTKSGFRSRGWGWCPGPGSCQSGMGQLCSVPKPQSPCCCGHTGARCGDRRRA